MAPITRRLRGIATKPWVVMPLVAVVLLAGWLVVRPSDAGSTSTATTASADTTRLVTASMGSQAQTVTATGTVEAAETEDLSFTSAGTVTAVHVEAGDTVTAGQVLATIDPVDLDATVAEAEASLAEAEAQLDEDDAAGASDAQIEADQANVVAAEDQLASAQEAREGASLVASFEGTVASVDLTVGEQLGSSGAGGTSQTGSGSGSGLSSGTLGSSGQSLPGTSTGATDQSSGSVQIQVVSTGRYTVELGFDSTDVADLAVGQSAAVARSSDTSGNGGLTGFGGGGGFPGGGAGGFGGEGGFPGGGALPGQDQAAADDADTGDEAEDEATDDAAPATIGEAVDGEVTEVGKVASASDGVATFPVTVTFSDTSGDINPGSTVSVTITYAEGDDALLVPSLAVTTEGDESTVQVSVDDELETRAVTVGETVDGMTAITSGLEEGDQVALALGGGPGGGRFGG